MTATVEAGNTGIETGKFNTSCLRTGSWLMEESAAFPPVLFSLQVDVESVALTAGLHDVMTGSLSVGFQLLQYELILLEELGKPSSSCCVFEADPAQLKLDLETEAAPVTFLVLDRSSQERARLVAFAAVALDSDNVAISSRLDRVCEWVRERGSWAFQNHANEQIGTLSATITLSCLGRVPLPKLEVFPTMTEDHRIDSQAIKGPMEIHNASPKALQLNTASCDANEDRNAPREYQSGLPSDKVSATVAARETVDSGVQCEDTVEGNEHGHSVVPSVWTANNSQQMIRMKSTKKSVSNAQGDRLKKKPIPRSSVRKKSVQFGSPSSMYHSSAAPRAEAVTFEREPPPPLFFRKSMQGK